MSGDPPTIELPEQSRRLLEATRIVLATPGLPPLVLIGGLAVTMRTSASGTAHRATIDVDFVTGESEPTAIEVLADAHDTARQPLIIDDVKVDLIATGPISDDDLDGLTDQDRLFVAGHRWAFESGQMVRLATAASDPLTGTVATTAGLIATKSHAIGYPTSRRRATKHASDLLDVFRLVDLYNRDASLSHMLREGPTDLARIIADVLHREIIANVAGAAKQMKAVAPAPIDPDEVSDVIGDFVDELRR